MTEVAPGNYEVEVSFPLKGVWDILVGVRHGEEEFHSAYRLSVGVPGSP